MYIATSKLRGEGRYTFFSLSLSLFNSLQFRETDVCIVD